MSSEFGPKSTNPRMRRAYAHAQLGNFRTGSVSSETAREAVDAASYTRKGKASGFDRALSNIIEGKVAKDAVVFIDWTGGHVDRPAFGGYVMPRDEGPVWEQRHQSAVEDQEYTGYNAIHGAGYPTVTLTTTADQEENFQWGKAYPIAANPAEAQLVGFAEGR